MGARPHGLSDGQRGADAGRWPATTGVLSIAGISPRQPRCAARTEERPLKQGDWTDQFRYAQQCDRDALSVST